jgi:dihydrofolate synthase/folylpolyglutamate synthase
VFGDARLVIEPRLPDAIEAATASAMDTDREPDLISGVGVIITGSVAMVGDARTYFGKDPQ